MTTRMDPNIQEAILRQWSLEARETLTQACTTGRERTYARRILTLLGELTVDTEAEQAALALAQEGPR